MHASPLLQQEPRTGPPELQGRLGPSPAQWPRALWPCYGEGRRENDLQSVTHHLVKDSSDKHLAGLMLAGPPGELELR